MRKTFLLVLGGALLALAGYVVGDRNLTVVNAQSHTNAHAQAAGQEYAAQPVEGSVPKSYGHVAAAIADQIGTGLVFEDSDGTIRFVSMTGMKEGELARYDQTATRGGIPKSYGHLVAAVVNSKGTGLVFEDAQGVIRFLTLTGKVEGELVRN
jgi:hypothetical protein